MVGEVSLRPQRRTARRPATAGLALLGLLLYASLSVSSSRAGTKPLVTGPIVLHSAANDVSPPLRTLGTIRPPLASPVGMTGGGTLLGPVESFEGIANEENAGGAQTSPPDANGAVGPHDYVQWVNYSLAVYDKFGMRELGPIPGSHVWSGFGGPCETLNTGDPVVRYDQRAGRWVLSQLGSDEDGSPPYAECFAVSTGPDPLGTYYRYQFDLPDCCGFNDYVKVAVWQNAYYMTDDRYGDGVTLCNGTPLSGGSLGSGAFAFDRAAMLAGRPATGVEFDLDQSLFGILPSDLDGITDVPAGTPDVFVRVDDDACGAPRDELELWTLSVSFATPQAATFTLANVLPTAPFNLAFCPVRATVAQPDQNPALDLLSGRTLFRVSVRDLGGHESLVALHVDVGPDGRAGLRWYQIQDPARTNGARILQQASYFGPPGDTGTRWAGSVAQDGDGDIALGYSVIGPNLPPSIGYVGHSATASDASDMTDQGLLVTGGGFQTGMARWGDYSSLTVDPVDDDCTFWYTQEYYPVSAPFDWHTRIGSFRFPGCGPQATITPADQVQEGETLTARPGSWPTLPGASFAYQWRRCDAHGKSCTDIPGTTGASYVVANADVDGTLRAVVRASTQAAEASALSEPTGVITPIPAPGPLELSSTISASPTTVAPGGLVAFTVAVGNGSLTGSATNVVLEVDLPPGAQAVSETFDRGTGCTGQTEVTCQLDFLPGGRTGTVTVTARLPVRGPQATVARVSAQQAPVDPAAVRSAVTVQVVGAPKLAASGQAATQRTATTLVVSGAFSSDEAARLTVRAVEANGKALTLLAGSTVGRATLRKRATSIGVSAAAGTVRLSLRIARPAGSGRVIVRATDRHGLTTTLVLRFHG